MPLVDGELLVDYERNATQAERIAARLRLGARLSDCVKYGYLIGRDGKTRRQAFADAARSLHAKR
mgnify:FL=1